MRAPRAASSQVVQDKCGAKSVNCLAESVCVVSSFVFSFIFLAPIRGKHSFAKQRALLKRNILKQQPRADVFSVGLQNHSQNHFENRLNNLL